MCPHGRGERGPRPSKRAKTFETSARKQSQSQEGIHTLARHFTVPVSARSATHRTHTPMIDPPPGTSATSTGGAHGGASRTPPCAIVHRFGNLPTHIVDGRMCALGHRCASLYDTSTISFVRCFMNVGSAHELAGDAIRDPELSTPSSFLPLSIWPWNFLVRKRDRCGCSSGALDRGPRGKVVCTTWSYG